ncbi:MAG: hypothetical protein ACKV2T_25910 [Kofleriaceae bacterium]
MKSLPQMEKEFPAESWPPAATAPTGGLPRMIQIWEKLRELNTGGYGGHRLVQVSGWAGADTRKNRETSCSPFTATAIGMMFDTDGGVDKAVWTPKFDGGSKLLGDMFYWHHNGCFKNYYPTVAYLKKHKAKFPYNVYEMDNSAISCVFWGLAYEIDARDMRRGDMVGINWNNNGGHATFCWDVHLNDEGYVDAFQYLSSNGNASGGIGVSVGGDPVPNPIGRKGDSYFVKDTVFKDRDEYIERGTWNLLPSQYLGGKKFDPTSFKKFPQFVSWQGPYAVGKVSVARFFGFKPPENPHGKAFTEAAEAKRMYNLHKFEAPEPTIHPTGTCEKPGAKKASSKPTPKSNPEPKKAVAPTEVKQTKDDAQGFQFWIETTLAELFHAKWITKDPGQPDQVVDAQSKAALEDFQAKFGFKPVDGIGSPEVRKLLKQALDDLRAGKPNPNEKNRKAEIETFYFSPNTIDPGDSIKVGVTGKNLDLIKKYEVTISDGKATEKVTLSMDPKSNIASGSLRVPAKFAEGSTLELSVSGEGATKSSGAKLAIKKPSPRAADWPWDEKKWPKHVQDMVAQLRQHPRGKGGDVRRDITQYGIWDRVPEGDVAILDQKGRPLGHTDKKSLFLADIAGAMRVNGKILNLAESGNVYDPRAGTAIFDKFDPKRSKWIDVSNEAPWGMGAKMPLIPYRTLAYNAGSEKDLYGKKVYIKQLDGVKLPTGEVHNGICIIGDCGSMEPEKQFDLFVGPEGRRVSIPPQCTVEIL